jgi:uracil-DNA glycosylase
MTERDSFIDNLQAFLEYKQEEGVQTLEISGETLAALRPVLPAGQRSDPAPRRAAPAPQPVPRRPAAAAPQPAAPSSGITVTGKTLDEIAKQVAACTACPLSGTRKHTVPGEGKSDAPDILFIGEGPGAEEDEQGRPFVGKAGQLLDKMIAAMGYRRDEVFIANIVKCRPSNNRVPLPEEMAACMPYLQAQIKQLRPKVIVALGKTSIEGLLNKKVAITRFRGTWCDLGGIPLMPTYHPAYLLRSPDRKGEAWADLKAVLSKLGKEPPAKNRST